MILRKCLVVLFLSAIAYRSSAQEIEHVLAKLSQVAPEEVVYTQTDKSHYFEEDTIWFKSYVMQAGLPSTISTTLLADLADAAGKLIRQTKWPMVESSAAGFFALNDLKPGTYQFRAYTPWMMNSDTAFFFRKIIQIVQASTAGDQKAPFDYSVQFLPEGGHWVEGIVNNMAFIGRSSDGKPITFTGKITDEETGETVVEIQSIHDGMGSFLMLPMSGKKYSATIEAAGKVKTFPLPPSVTNALAMRVQMTNEHIMFQVQTNGNIMTADTNIIVAAYMNQQLVYKALARVSRLQEGISGRIPLAELSGGTLVLSVFAKGLKPLAERICFIPPDSILYPKLALNTFKLDVKKHGMNMWDLELPDSGRSNLSVSVTDADVVPGPEFEENIITKIFLTSEIKGRVHNPGWYLSKPYDSTRRAIDLLMLTQGWRKYNWDFLARGIYPPVRVKPESYLSLRGDVMSLHSRKILPNQELLLFLQTKDSSRQLLTVVTDAGGNFNLPGMVFFDTAQVFYQLNKSQGDAKDVQLRLSPAVHSLLQPLPSLADKLAYLYEDEAMKKFEAERNRLLDRFRNDKNTLAEVVIRGRKKSPLQELNDRYTSGMFTSDDATSFDFINDPPMGFMDIFQYLQGRVAGLQINSNGAQVSASYRGGSPAFFLDEMPTDAQMLQNINVNDIAMVKVFRPPFMGAMGGGSGGAIALYTKKGNEHGNAATGMENTTVRGYTMYKSFYSPDYEEDPEANPFGDFRSTLYWQPYIFVGSGEGSTSIKFFNNDVTKRFRIVVEGVNSIGQLIRYESVVE